MSAADQAVMVINFQRRFFRHFAWITIPFFTAEPTCNKTMGWPSWPFSSLHKSSQVSANSRIQDDSISPSMVDTRSPGGQRSSWPSAYPSNDLAFYLSPQFLLPATLLTGVTLLGRGMYNAYLRRMPGASSVPATYFTKEKTLFGVVTSVGDGDGFRLFHTPGGRFAGWDWLPWRKIPTGRALKDQTVCCTGSIHLP